MMSLIVHVQARTDAHFPKSALHRRNTRSQTWESYGHWQIYDSGPLPVGWGQVSIASGPDEEPLRFLTLPLRN
jgi:hypothetical protein